MHGNPRLVGHRVEFESCKSKDVLLSFTSKSVFSSVGVGDMDESSGDGIIEFSSVQFSFIQCNRE